MKMKTWYVSVQLNTSNYETTVWMFLNSGQKPTDWNPIITSTIFKIFGALFAMLTPPPFGPLVAAAFAIGSDIVNDWETGSKPPPRLDAAYADIAVAIDKMRDAMLLQLNNLADPGNHYYNLRDYFQKKGEGGINVGDKNYTLDDLVASNFPKEGTEAFGNIWIAAVIKQKQMIWRLLLTKAGKLNSGGLDLYELKEEPNYTPTEFARDQFYRERKSGYLRGYYEKGYYYLRAWYFEVDGKRLTDAAAKELFIDDTPGHIMSLDATGKPNGL